VRVPPEKRPEDLQYNILDQTRIHYRHYDYVYKIVLDCVSDDRAQDADVENYKKQEAVIEIIKNPSKLKDFAMNEYKEQLKKIDNNSGIGYIFD